jgi:hypothetical protein
MQFELASGLVAGIAASSFTNLNDNQEGTMMMDQSGKKVSFRESCNFKFCRLGGDLSCAGRAGSGEGQPLGRLASGSKRVQHAVAVFFGVPQPVTEFQQIILRGTAGLVVDGIAHVSDQPLQFETVHRDDLDFPTELVRL